MKIKNEVFFVQKGSFCKSPEFSIILSDIRSAILSVYWGESGEFIINPVRRGNGVKPIKHTFISRLEELGWAPEKRLSLVKGVSPGPIDAVKNTPEGLFAVEWETGNISSSHRALNKIATGIIQGNLIGGILVLPVRTLAQYLTDRVGNFEELSPYFPMYSNLQLDSGIMGVISIEQDGLSNDVILIPKGKDGNAL